MYNIPNYKEWIYIVYLNRIFNIMFYKKRFK